MNTKNKKAHTPFEDFYHNGIFFNNMIDFIKYIFGEENDIEEYDIMNTIIEQTLQYGEDKVNSMYNFKCYHSEFNKDFNFKKDEINDFDSLYIVNMKRKPFFITLQDIINNIK